MLLRKLAGLALVLALFAPRQGLAQMQSGRDVTELSMDIYQRANTPDALARMRKDLVNAPEAYLVALDQPGTLVLPDRRRVRVPAMKYNVALHLLEARDSTGSHVWPPGSLDGFYLGRGAEARHFRTYTVRNGSTKTDFVEVLTVDDDSPLVVALQHVYLHEDAVLDPILRTEVKKERTEIGQVVLAGASTLPREPLRPLQLNERAVLRLFGMQYRAVQEFAAKEHLSYTDLTQVLRMVEYFNQRLPH